MSTTRGERLEYTAIAEKLLGRMTLEEKVSLMSGDVSLKKVMDAKQSGFHFNYEPYNAGGNEYFNVPKLRFCDGPRGVVCGYGKATCFPVPMLRGATFDIQLEKEIGHAIGREVRAFGGNFFGGVCINLPYHPCWGRSQEVYGEDSFHLGAMGSAIVDGIQSEYVIACLKHFAFNSMENSRFKVDINCEQRTEREVFLPHFKECIDTGAAAIMTAYNRYRGIPCGHSHYLLRKVLKEEWNFDGFVICDFFWGISDTAEAVNAGLDIEMCHTHCYGEKLVKAVRSGVVDEACIDEAALRIIRTLLVFEEGYAGSGKVYGDETIGCQKHIELSLRAAQEGITLIKNNNNVLPLSKNLNKIAVIGKLASEMNIGDFGSSRVYPKYVVTPLEGILKSMQNTEVIFYSGDNLSHMKHLCEASEAVIFVVGLDYKDEGEYNPLGVTSIDKGIRGGDRENLDLHQQEIDMLNNVGAINPNSVVVLMGGSTITAAEWEKNIPAILYAYYPGQEGGTAIAQIIFGEINPSGKLPFVIPEKVAALPEINRDAVCQQYEYYHGYRRLEKMAIRPFRPYGFGMSYTTFALSEAAFMITEDNIVASALIKNTGMVQGTEVVQMYIGFQKSKWDRPVKSLCGFKRILLCPGEIAKVKISCPMEKIKYYDVEKQGFEMEHMDYEIYIGTSSDTSDLLQGVITI